jgi:hypothetical protein
MLAAMNISSTAATQKVSTADGRQVYLNDNGTWRYVTQADIATEKAAHQDSVVKAAVEAVKIKERAKEIAADTASRPKMVEKKRAPDEPERAALVDVIRGDRGFDVRKAHWGMTKEAVKKSEILQLLTDAQDRIEYRIMLIGIQSRIVYKFSNGALSGAEYRIEQDDVNPARFYDDFANLKEYLRKLYGIPVADNKIWENDIYKGDERNWGFAISLGFLACTTEWQNATTKIALNQTGGNHLIKTNIEYFAKASAK